MNQKRAFAREASEASLSAGEFSISIPNWVHLSAISAEYLHILFKFLSNYSDKKQTKICLTTHPK